MIALVIVLIIIVSGASVYATSAYLASQVTYKDGKNVEQALNDLYTKMSTFGVPDKVLTGQNGVNVDDDYSFAILFVARGASSRFMGKIKQCNTY